MVLEEIQMAPGEFGEVMGFTGLAADRAGKQAAAVGGNLQVQFVWLLAGLQPLIDQSPRQRHSKPQSQYGIRVHFRPAHLDLRQCASVLVTLQDAARRYAMAGGHPGPSLRALAKPVQVGTRGWSLPVEPEDETDTRQRIKWGRRPARKDRYPFRTSRRQKYVVKLGDEEREQLNSMINKGKHPA